MKILTLIPLWKRPEVVKLCVAGLKKIPVTPLFVLSPEDPNYDELKEIIKGHNYIEFPNNPLGLKMNMGIAAGLTLEWDYLMNMGSDDVIEPRLFEEMQPYFDAGEKLIGYDSCFVVDFKNKAKYYLKNVCIEYPIGAGRMIHRSIIEAMFNDGYNLYTDEKMRGMDGDSTNRMKFATGVEPIIIFTENPPIIDYKTNTNINPIQTIWKHLKKSE